MVIKYNKLYFLLSDENFSTEYKSDWGYFDKNAHDNKINQDYQVDKSLDDEALLVGSLPPSVNLSNFNIPSGDIADDEIICVSSENGVIENEHGMSSIVDDNKRTISSEVSEKLPKKKRISI